MTELQIKSVLCFAAAVIYMVLYMVLCSTGSNAVFCGVMFVGCYIFTAVVLEVLYYFIVYRNLQISKEEQKAVSDITRELLIRLDMPVAICDGQGKIIWHNKLFSDIFGDENYFGRGVEALCGIDYRRLTSEQGKRALYECIPPFAKAIKDGILPMDQVGDRSLASLLEMASAMGNAGLPEEQKEALNKALGRCRI